MVTDRAGLREVLGVECEDVEFKTSLPKDVLNWMKTVCAFANGNGGSVYMGVDDKGRIVGVKEGELESMLDSISQKINDTVSPKVCHEESVVDIDGKPVIRVRVASGALKPYSLKNGSVFIRKGRSTICATEMECLELRLMCSAISWDSMPFLDPSGHDRPVGNGIVELMSEAIGGCTLQSLASMGYVVDTPRGYVESNALDVITRNTMAGCDCIRSAGIDGIMMEDHQVFTGPLEWQIDSVMGFVRFHVSGEGIVPDCPIDAIEEAVINAVVHRDYTLTGGSVIVAVHDDRVEVTSHGMPLVEVADIKRGMCRSRNPLIARYMCCRSKMRGFGTGYMRMCASCRDHGAFPPKIDVIGDSLVVTFFRGRFDEAPPDDPSTLSDEKDVLCHCIMDPFVKRREISKYLGIEKARVDELIHNLMARGVLCRRISMNGSFWSVDRDRMEGFYGIRDPSEDRLDQDHVEDSPGSYAEEDVPLPEVQDDDGQSGDQLRDAIGIGEDRCGPQTVHHEHAYDRWGQYLPDEHDLRRDLLSLGEHQERCGTGCEGGDGYRRDHDQ